MLLVRAGCVLRVRAGSLYVPVHGACGAGLDELAEQPAVVVVRLCTVAGRVAVVENLRHVLVWNTAAAVRDSVRVHKSTLS